MIDYYYRVGRWLVLSGLILLSSLALTLEPQPGSITIVKEASLESPQPFQFNSTITNAASFTLIDDGSGTNRLTILAAPGLYQISEAPVAGWILEKAVCDNGDPIEAIALDSGEAVTCTFYNLYEIVEPPTYFQFLPFFATAQ